VSFIVLKMVMTLNPAIYAASERLSSVIVERERERGEEEKKIT